MEKKPKSKNQILENIFRQAVRKELQSFIPMMMNEIREINFSGLNPRINVREQLGQIIDPYQSHSQSEVLMNSLKVQSQPFVTESLSLNGLPQVKHSNLNLSAIGNLMSQTQNTSEFREFMNDSPTTYED